MRLPLITFVEEGAAATAETSLTIVRHGVGSTREGDSDEDGCELHGRCRKKYEVIATVLSSSRGLVDRVLHS